MAEALVNVLLERLASITIDKINRELKLVTGVDKQVEDLTRNLKAIQDVLEDAELRQVGEASVRRWLNDLKQVSNEIDNVLDEWSTEILKHQILKQDEEETQKVALTKNKVRFHIPSPSSSRKVNKVLHRRDIAKKIEDLNERLNKIADDKRKYKFKFHNTERRGGEQLGRQKTSSLQDISFGRENEKINLVNKLVNQSSQKSNGPLIIPIIGLGGTGKTSLSQHAYNHQRVKAHFDLRIWVCVSDPFDEIKIAKDILVGLSEKDASNLNELEPLVQRIKERIQERKFLLVLDDVWNPKPRQWEELSKPLRNGGIGSTILVTTRKEKVAKMMRATSDIIHLQGLSEEHCRSLFYYFAFSDWKRDDLKKFEDVGNDIVKKCKGLPLAAKTLGSLMCGKKKLKEWQDVLKSKIWELEEIEQEVFQPLLLSYYDLTPAIRRCLLYCAIFPKDFVMDKDDLIKLWMSQDYLDVEGKREQKKIGQAYFDDLVMRSFFQDFEKYDDENIIRCKMHDIVHDFVQYLTKKECFIMEIKGSNERIELPDDNILHLTMMFASEGPFPISFCNFKFLRTFTTFYSNITTIGPDLILQLKFVRTLNLRSNCIDEISEEISKLIHLRYLDLSMNEELEELPDAIGELFNLQTLRIDYCRGLKKVPDMGRLINLKHFHVWGTRGANIKGIGRLRNLQTVDEFNVGADNEGGLKLADLKNLDDLQGSLNIIHIGRTEDASQAEKAQLVNKKDLLHLGLDFGCGCELGEEEEEHKNDGEILNALQPHPGLESLSIWRCYNTTSSPNWLMSLQNLRKLSLEIPDCTFLPPLGKLSSLESLEIWSCRKIGKIGVEFLGLIDDKQTSSSSSSQSQTLFPKLKELRFSWMEDWEEWEGVEGWREEEDSHDQITIMPSLSTLTFQLCPKLETLPNFLRKTPLQKLLINYCPSLANACKEGRGKEWDKISHTTNIIVDYHTTRQMNRHLSFASWVSEELCQSPSSSSATSSS